MKRLNQLSSKTKFDLLIFTLAAIWLVTGIRMQNPFACCVAGAAGLWLLLRWNGRRTTRGPAKKRFRKRIRPLAGEPPTIDAIVQRMLDQGRSAILLRPESYKKLTAEQRIAAEECLDENMTRVTAGKVWLYAPSKQEVENGACPGKSTHTSDVLVDRCAVTNHEFQMFVDDGGYADDEYWHQSESMQSQFTDTTGKPGPRFWANGAYPKGQGHLPVVGVSWFEANAYAQWAGKRLATGPEWVKAAVAPTATASVPSQQRKFPWGASVEASQANLWQSGIGKRVSVTDFTEVAIHEIYQMVGNVWEWNHDDFATWQAESGWDSEVTALKSIRGGAFDTYLESQAACPVQSGEEPYARRHNIGFRCVADPGQLVLQD